MLIIGSYNEDGTANAMTAAWGAMSDYTQIFLALDFSHKTAANILKRKAFTVSVVDANHVKEADYVGMVSGNDICDKVENVSLMTNSIGNNGNPFGSADYYVNKDKILNTGLEVWEYEGGYSYHGKSILIDDNISVIGSFNVDMRSVYLDTELMLVIDSREINSQLNEAMESYEHIARKADADGSYDNPYDVEPVELTPYREKRMKLIKNFILWTRYLF